MGLFDVLGKLFSKPAVPLVPTMPTAPVPVAAPIPAMQAPVEAPKPVPERKLSVGLTVEHLLKMHVSPANAQKYVGPLNIACEKMEINTHSRICHFISQICEESGNLSTTHENLGYNTKNMMTVWPKRFPTVESTLPYLGKPDLLANSVYGNRMGNTEPGDGYKYRGRGFIQLTGKSNYAAAAKRMGIDFVKNPDLVALPEYIALVAADYWKHAGCNQLADVDTFAQITVITQRINGGLTNLKIRQEYWQRAKLAFADIK